MIKKGQSDSEIKKNIKEKVTTLNKEFSPTILSAIQQLLSLEIDNDSWQNLEPVQRRKYIFDALNSLLIRLSEEKPLIIVVDDLQWIDRTSVDFLSNFKDLS
jgi:predicted ATPase